MAPALSKEFLDIQANYREWIHSETHMLHDNNMQSRISHYMLSAAHVKVFLFCRKRIFLFQDILVFVFLTIL